MDGWNDEWSGEWDQSGAWWSDPGWSTGTWTGEEQQAGAAQSGYQSQEQAPQPPAQKEFSELAGDFGLVNLTMVALRW